MIPIVFSIITKPPFGQSYIYEGFADAVRCAVRYSGQPVYVITDATLATSPGVRVLPISRIISCTNCDPFMRQYNHLVRTAESDGRIEKNGLYRLNIPSTLRWYYLCRAIERNILPSKVFFIDWDVLIFSNIEEACAPFAEYDLLSADMHPLKVSQSPCGMFSLAALKDMIALVLKKVRDEQRIALDMGSWTEVYNTGKYTIADIGLEHVPTASVFDGNLGDLEDSQFEPDETGYKKLVWIDKKPHLVSKDGHPVRAHTLHCWGEYKHRTNELYLKSV